MGFTVKRVLRRVLRSGSEKGVSRRCLERPLGEYDPLGVRPTKSLDFGEGKMRNKKPRTILLVVPQGQIRQTIICQKRPFVHNSVCSQCLEGLFAILAESA